MFPLWLQAGFWGLVGGSAQAAFLSTLYPLGVSVERNAGQRRGFDAPFFDIFLASVRR